MVASKCLHILFHLVSWCYVLDFGTSMMFAFFFALDLITEHLVILFLVVYRTMIQNMIKEGKIVPSEVTIKLLQKAMHESENDKFLIDGFPRNEENRAAFEAVTKIEPAFVLFFDCPEEEMERRILSRNEGRVDDNIETIRKRFKVFQESSLPVVEYYDSKGKVRKIDAAKPVEEVFEAVKSIITPKEEKDSSKRSALVCDKAWNLEGTFVVQV
ncbi:NUCLEOTIDE KINASE [Salix viminalis]|uniref:adenylate kinase n=1 Tax=Salix viminalis TaxID=40686 RepID=A0A9Q0ZD59_SALVM|nr:NUCLEOTIDE KINASE [Salix viminalis]